MCEERWKSKNWEQQLVWLPLPPVGCPSCSLLRSWTCFIIFPVDSSLVILGAISLDSFCMLSFFSNLPVEHLILCFCNVADVIGHVPQIHNSCAHLQRYHSHPKHLAGDDDLDCADLIHVLLHLLLPGVLLSRLVRRCNEAVVRVQALAVESVREIPLKIFWLGPYLVSDLSKYG